MTVRVLLSASVETATFSPSDLATAAEDAKSRTIKRGHLITRHIVGRDREFGFSRLVFDVLVVYDLDNIGDEIEYLRNMLSVTFDTLELHLTETWGDHYSNTEADTLRKQLVETLRDMP